MPDDHSNSELPIAAQATVPVEKSFRYQTLDAWRGFACVLLVIFHSTMHMAKHAKSGEGWLEKTGHALLKATSFFDVGVPLFFVISGYCIMATLDARSRKGEGVGIYFWRRFHRIYPPYWIALGVSAVTIFFIERYCWPRLFTRSAFVMTSPMRLSGWEWLGNFTLTESWRFHLTGGQSRYLIGHAWTLCYEEQFYAVAGLILLLAPKRMFLAAFFMTAGILGIGFWAGRSGVDLGGTILGGHWFIFAAGIAAYYRIHYAGKLGRLLIAIALAASMLLPALDARRLVFGDAHARFGWIAAMLFAFLLTTLHRHDTELASWKMTRLFSRCGKMCYSLYLIHPLVTTGLGHASYRWGLRGNWETLLITLPLCFTLSLAISAVFFLVVERHFLNGLHPSRGDVSPNQVPPTQDANMIGLVGANFLPTPAPSATA